MHGRKKPTQAPSATELTAVQRKTQQLSQTIAGILQKKINDDLSEEAFELTGKVLRTLTDFYSIWNYRRRILESKMIEIKTTKDTKLHNPTLVEVELTLTEECIKKNPKSYGAWHHRLWVLERFQVDYDKELELCRLFLKEDQRNFHCWNYRRSVVQIGCLQSQSEFAFSTEKIEENFSNYSAFHHRSVFIREITEPPLAAGPARGADAAHVDGNQTILLENKREIILGEFSLIEQAIYTEPDDQSAWWYHQFLLRWTLQSFTNSGSSSSNNNSTKTTATTAENSLVGNDERDDSLSWYCEHVLHPQMRVVRELLQAEQTSKWALVSLSMMIEMALRIRPTAAASMETADSLRTERTEILHSLCAVDPDHADRYRYLQTKVS